ncbi:DUF4468 domain-containing protein [Halpernia sp. GG3]
MKITKDGLTNAIQVINLDGLSAKEIYSRVNKYIQKNYTNPDKVSKGNIENEFISFNGIYAKNSILWKVALTKYYFDLEYYFDIDIKDNKFRLSITKLNERRDSMGFTGDGINLLMSNPMNYFKKDGSVRSMYSDLIQSEQDATNKVLMDFVSSKNKKTIIGKNYYYEKSIITSDNCDFIFVYE